VGEGGDRHVKKGKGLGTLFRRGPQSSIQKKEHAAAFFGDRDDQSVEKVGLEGRARGGESPSTNISSRPGKNRHLKEPGKQAERIWKQEPAMLSFSVSNESRGEPRRGREKRKPRGGGKF